jgi:HK97 family phage prohead protease
MKKSSKTFVISDETPNMYGFITVTSGIDLSDFQENPVMLYNHDYSKVIGQWVDVRKEGDKLLGAPAFDENDPEAMKYYDKVEQGILKGASPGLRPIQFNDDKDRLLQSSVKEASITPVPGNRKSLSMAVYNNDDKKLSASEVKEFLLSFQPTTPKANQLNMNEKLIAALIVLSAQLGLTVNLSASSKDDDLVDAIKKAGDAFVAEKTKVTNLSAKVLSLEATAEAISEKEITDLLNQAVTDKRLSAEQVPALREFAKVNLSAFKTTLASLKAATVVTHQAAKDAGTGNNDAKADWTFDDYALKAPQELENMQVADNTRFQLLLSAKVNKARNDHSIEV